ncbi:MAG: tail fiber domain-containing protein [Chthoniobacterales bacterium]|nr:tail fiber domain-containing protein [Chthoniobacterales bacterium]
MKTNSLVLAVLVFATPVFAVDPPPDGGYPNRNTAEGQDALFSLTTGSSNAAVGFDALYSNTFGSLNTALGYAALMHNTSGAFNTGSGWSALYDNTTGSNNTADGVAALYSNTTGSSNTASGANALTFNTTGYDNTASGSQALTYNTAGIVNTADGVGALSENTVGSYNTAAGYTALVFNTQGNYNTASGAAALSRNTTGSNNTAVGISALSVNTTGSTNIALGNLAGSALTTGDNNIDLGNKGAAGESGAIRIGTEGTHTGTYIAGIRPAPLVRGAAVAVGITSDGQLGVRASAARFKEGVKPMDKTSEAIFSLQPVTFHYKKDPDAVPQFGLVAEQVATVKPDLVTCDAEGKPYTVRDKEVNAMLLNEFLKEHKKVEQQASDIAQIKSALAEVTARLDAKRP